MHYHIGESFAHWINENAIPKIMFTILEPFDYRHQNHWISLKQSDRSPNPVKEEAFILTEKFFCFLMDTEYWGCCWCSLKNKWATATTQIPFQIDNITKECAFFIVFSWPASKKDIWRLQKDTWKQNWIVGLMRCRILHFTVCLDITPACHHPPSLSPPPSPCTLLRQQTGWEDH